MATVSYNETRSVNYGSKTIEYHLFYFNRKTMEIAVHPDCNVIVKAPIGTHASLIEQKIIRRARWITKQLNYFLQYEPKTPKRCYVNGETHLYLGKQYRLKATLGLADDVKLTRGFFQVAVRDAPTPDKIQKLMNAWYLKRAKVQFQASLLRCWAKFNKYSFKEPQISIKRMKMRWGSLTNKETMTLNVELVKASKECIDYVISHELCHLKYNNHSPDFYKLLELASPGWKKIKHKLEISMS